MHERMVSKVLMANISVLARPLLFLNILGTSGIYYNNHVLFIYSGYKKNFLHIKKIPKSEAYTLPASAMILQNASLVYSL